MIEPLLLTTARVSTFFGAQALTGATGFFFERGDRLFMVTNRHVLIDRPSGHLPDRIEIEVHTDAANLTQAAVLSVWLYRDGEAIWRQGRDVAGEIDVAAIELDRSALPAQVDLRCFTPAQLQHSRQDRPQADDLRRPPPEGVSQLGNGPSLTQEVQVGTPLLVVGFPLGFHDTLHHLPVVRQAVIASSFGLRFQGQGYFLTDARTHRGTSGAPVVMHDPGGDPAMPWKLLGVHSARMEMGGRDLRVDESLGLNCAWYADILLTLTADNTADSTSDRMADVTADLPPAA